MADKAKRLVSQAIREILQSEFGAFQFVLADDSGDRGKRDRHNQSCANGFSEAGSCHESSRSGTSPVRFVDAPDSAAQKV